MGLDTIIYAVVAVVLLARLWTVFGRRNEEDKERPNPFIITKQPPRPDEDASFASPDAARPNEALNAFKAMKFAPSSLAGGLQQIKELDPSFDEKQFLQGAKQAFAMIVEDFAKGDMARITRYLGPDVLAQFQRAIEARRAAGQVMESKVTAVKDAESVAARVEGTRAVITVRFVSEQENTLRDSGGQIIGGGAGKLEEITDMWSFARDTKSADPNWLLAETHA